jgi:hypothetical protein
MSGTNGKREADPKLVEEIDGVEEQVLKDIAQDIENGAVDATTPPLGDAPDYRIGDAPVVKPMTGPFQPTGEPEAEETVTSPVDPPVTAPATGPFPPTGDPQANAADGEPEVAAAK